MVLQVLLTKYGEIPDEEIMKIFATVAEPMISFDTILFHFTNYNTTQ